MSVIASACFNSLCGECNWGLQVVIIERNSPSMYHSLYGYPAASQSHLTSFVFEDTYSYLGQHKIKRLCAQSSADYFMQSDIFLELYGLSTPWQPIQVQFQLNLRDDRDPGSWKRIWYLVIHSRAPQAVNLLDTGRHSRWSMVVPTALHAACSSYKQCTLFYACPGRHSTPTAYA